MRSWIDLQVNGIGGVNFSNPNLTLEEIRHASQILFQHGTTGFLPTVITSDINTYRKVLPTLAKAAALLKFDQSCSKILGIHLEGPYISSLDGARGVHPKEYCRLPSIDEFDELFALSKSNLRLITLAPELPGAIHLIEHVTQKDVLVSLGHTLAHSHHIEAAVEAGARLTTHLGNGLPLLIHRHDNPIWPQLANPLLSVMIIADGHHLPIDFIRIVIKVKGANKVIVVSDSSPAAKLPVGEYTFFHTKAVLKSDGKLYDPSTGLLAGSSATLDDCMKWLKTHGISDSMCDFLGRKNPLKMIERKIT